MADNVLGISGSLDINDIVKSIDRLYDEVGKIEGVSKKMAEELEKAYTAVGKASKEELEEKSRKALEVFSKAFEEAKTSADKNVTKIEASITRLQDKLAKVSVERSDTVTGTKTFDRLTRQMESLNTQIHNQQQALISARENAQSAGDSYATFLNHVATANSAIDALNAVSGISTTATGLNAAAHAAAGIAVANESAQHGANAEKIKEETEAINDNRNALTSFNVQEATGETEGFIKTAEQAKERLIEMMEKVIALREELMKNEQGTREYSDALEKYSVALSNANNFADMHNIPRIPVEEIKMATEAMNEQKVATQTAASEEQKATEQTTDKIKEETEAIKAKKAEILAFEKELAEVRARIANILKVDDVDSFTAALKGIAMHFNPKALFDGRFLEYREGSDYIDELKSKIAELRQEVADLTEQNKQAAQATQEAATQEKADANETIDVYAVKEKSISELKTRIAEVTKEISDNEQQLSKLRENKGFDEQGEKARDLKGRIAEAKKEMEALNKELEGRSAISKFFANLKGSINGLGSNIKETFSSLKGGFSSGGSGISGFFSLLSSGKFWGWATAIGAVAGGVKKLSDEAESLNKAMKPLKAYVDDDTLGKLRESFINTAYQGSAQSTEDMAAAAARWVKYYEGLRKAPEAIQAVVDASRDLATITGTSADKATESITKIGGQFHLSALEATEAVNVIVNATRNSTVSYDEMISALVSSGAKVNQNGSTFKEYAAAVSLTSSQYGGASQAASAYQLILQKLSTETNSNFNPKVVGVTKAFQNLHKAMEKGEDLHKKFGTRLWSQAQYFVKNADEIANYTEKLDGADGKLAALNSKEETAEHNQKELQNAMAALAQEINLNLTHAFVTVIDSLTNIVTWCHNAGGAIKDFFTDIDNWLKDNLGERMYDALFVDENALWDSNYKSKWSGKQKVKWTERETRKEYRNLLEKNGGTLGNAQILLKAYDDNDSSGLSREEVQQIIREENEKWLKEHKVLAASNTKGNSNNVGDENKIIDPNANKELQKQEKQQERYLALLQKQGIERERAIKDMQFATRQAEIEAMADGSEKTIKQLQLDFEKRRDEIERGYEDLKQQKIEAAKKIWEANPANKGKAFDASIVDTTYSNAEIENRQKQLDAAFAAYVKSLNREEQANRDAINTYLKQYGDYGQKKQAINESANDRICELEEQLSYNMTSEARKAIEARVALIHKETDAQIEELDQQYGKAKQFMIDLFGDASKKSVAEIEKIIKKYEELEKFLQGDSTVTRKDLVSLGFTNKELDQALDKLSQGKITVKDYTDALKNMKGELAERSPWQKFKKDIGDALDMLKAANGDNTKIGTAITNIGKACSDYMPEVERFSSAIYNLFGVDDKGAKSAISAMQGLSKAAEGIGQIASGQWMDGVVNAVDGVSQAFNGLADMIDDIGSRRDLDAEFNKIELKAIHKAVDKIVDKFEGDSISEAIKDYEEALRLYTDSLEKAQRNVQDAFSKSSSNIAGRYNHHSINYYMNEIGSKEDIKKINDLLGVNLDSFSELWLLSPDQLAEVEQKLPHVFSIIEKGIEKMSENASASSDDENARAMLDAYMELVGKKKEIEEAFTLKMTGTTVASVKSDFKNMLSDMASDAETFSEHFEEMIRNSVINALMSDKYNAALEDWYQLFSDYYRNDSKLGEDEIADLRTRYKQISDEAIVERDALINAMADAEETIANSFDSLRSSFRSALLNMEGDTREWGKNIAQIMAEALVDRFVLGEDFDKWLNEWAKNYENIANATFKNKNDGTFISTNPEEIEAEKARLQEIVDMWGWLADRPIEMMTRDAIMLEHREEAIAALEALAKLDEYETYTEEERAAAIAELNNQLQKEMDLRKQMAKVYADMTGWTLWQKIDASPLANIGDELISALQDTSKGVEDWKKEIVNSLTNDLIKQIVYNDKFKEDIQKIQERYIALFEPDKESNKLTPEQIAAEVENIASELAGMMSAAEKQVEGIKTIIPDIDTSPFENMRDTFLDTLTDMDGDAESFKRKLQETLVKDLMERQVLDVPLTVTIDGEDKIFDNFDKYSEDWNKRYLDAVKSGNAELADALIDELMQVYGLTMQQAEELRERLKEIAKDTTFKDMTNSWVSNLMDFNATAEDWAENIGRTMAQKIIEQMIVPTLIQPLLDNLQTAFDTAMSEHGDYGTDWDWKKVIGADGVQEALQAIQAAYPELKETITAILAALNITPAAEDAKEAFNDLTGTIISGLTDAEMTAEEFSKNIARTLTEQLMKQIVESQFAETMKGIQEDWAKALESGDTSGIEAIRQRIVQLYKDAGRATDELRGIFEEVKEGDTTFKDMADSWVSALFDMDSTASDFGRQIGRTLVEKLVKELVVTKQLQKYLDDIQTAFDNAIGKEGATIESVLAAVTPAINAAVAATEQWKPVIEEISKAFQEIDKSTPLDNIRSNFLSQLMDMKSDTKDFARSINEILTEAFIDRFVLGEEFDKRLEEWKNEYASIMGGKYTEEERANLLKQLRQTIVIAKEGYAAEAQAIHEFMGTANYSDQTATMNLSDKMTHEDADLLVNVNVSQLLVQQQILQAITGGNVTPIDAIQAAPYTSLAEMTSTSNTAKQILATLQSMQAVTNPDDNSLSEISNKFDTANERLLAILRSVQSIKEYVASNVAASRGILGRL